MKILYFSAGYTTHDHRFLQAIQDGGHEVFHLRLEADARPLEDRPVPEQVRQVIWKGGRGAFRWSRLPALVADLRRVVREIRPDLIHAGPIQTCALLAVLSGFRPILTMSWGFDLMDDVHRNRWWELATRHALKRSDWFISDAGVTRGMAVRYGMDPGRTTVFPWGVDLDHFAPTHDFRPADTARRPPSAFTLFCNRSWEPRYGVDLLARAFVQAARENEHLDLILLGGGSQGSQIRRILESGGVMERVTFGGQISQNDLPRWYRMADLYISASHVDGVQPSSTSRSSQGSTPSRTPPSKGQSWSRSITDSASAASMASRTRCGSRRWARCCSCVSIAS
jgi:glycosyltransferase involved in cell wall biosynthesis